MFIGVLKMSRCTHPDIRKVPELDEDYWYCMDCPYFWTEEGMYEYEQSGDAGSSCGVRAGQD